MLLSRSLGEGETEKAEHVAGNGIFLGFCIYAIMSVTAFNYGMGDKKRVSEAALWGIADTAIVSVVITALFQIFAAPLSNAKTQKSSKNHYFARKNLR